MANSEKMNQELKAARSLNDVMRICGKYYDLDAPLGIMSKGVVLSSVPKIIKTIGAKPKI